MLLLLLLLLPRRQWGWMVHTLVYDTSALATATYWRLVPTPQLKPSAGLATLWFAITA